MVHRHFYVVICNKTVVASHEGDYKSLSTIFTHTETTSLFGVFVLVFLSNVNSKLQHNNSDVLLLY